MKRAGRRFGLSGKVACGSLATAFFQTAQVLRLTLWASMLVWRRVEREYWGFSWCLGCLGVQGFSISVVEFRTSKFSILNGL